ncbi:MAG TPA: FlgO family outer membrane protein [Candidatus Udaeobacter sp.]|jgi:serine/threonine-protein kinase
MISALRVCGKCGAEIPTDAPEGGCPGCLLQAGLSAFASEKESSPAQTENQNATTTGRLPQLAGEFGDYELLEEIGRGGQGIVYLARQRSLHRTVALKVIGLGRWATRAHIKRFRLEAEAAARLDHPCIVPIYEVGEREGSCYFSMKFVEGGQLDEVIKREPISIRRAVELIAKLARTVHYAHGHGVLHRDIKPGNILIDKQGDPHLTDFGLARLMESDSTVTSTRDVMGTPSYMAPEQATGNDDQLTSATDVYGLGAVLYQLLTGHPPFTGETSYETIRLLLNTEPRSPRLLNPKIHRDLCTICLKCLEKDPQRRYSSAFALAEDLEHWLKHEPIQAKRTGFVTHGRKWVQRNPVVAALIASLVALAAALGWNVWKSELVSRPAAKSIAVLPFSNLSKEEANAFLADGVQDAILTNLSRLADLKVIGRSSVAQYKSGAARNLRKVGEELGVAHVLEGTVQRAGNRLRVNAQLVDTDSGTVAWAEQYDRDLNDLFAVQSEIAQKVAKQLQIEISAAEKLTLERPPTTDLAAFDLYTRGRKLIFAPSFDAAARQSWLHAVDLLNQAVSRDPSFFRAYCQLAYVHNALYFFGHDGTPARLAMAEAAVQAAFRLRPDAGEAHLARAWNLYWGHLDYNGALAELEVARKSLPNNPQTFYLTGLIQRRQGHWEDSVRSLERSAELDPRNSEVFQQVAVNYAALGRYAQQQLWLGRILAFEPDNDGMKAVLAAIDFEWKANTRPLHQLIDLVRATNPDAVPSIAEWWLRCALAERDAAAAKDALLAAGENPINLGNDVFANRSFVEGLIARMENDDTRAKLAFTEARAEQEKIVRAEPNFGPPRCVLGLIDAALGRKEEALREGRRALELLPAEKDAIRGPAMLKYLAIIAAWVGEKDLACEQLATAVGPPGAISYGQLKLDPFWDPLRGHPRFEQIVASLAPK